MARRTSRDEGTNAGGGAGSPSTVPNLGSAQQSNYQWLGIDSRVEYGTPGCRPEISSAKYGGEREEGELFKGNSVSVGGAAKELNTREGGEMNSWNASGQYGPGSPNYLAGGYAARENMTIGGGENRGQYVGDGVNATPESNGATQYMNGQSIQMPRPQFLDGTDQAKTGNMARAERGIGRGGPRRDSKNQND